MKYISEENLANEKQNMKDDPVDQILELWEKLPPGQKELIIPRLLYTTNLGSRVKDLGLAWRPAYITRNRR